MARTPTACRGTTVIARLTKTHGMLYGKKNVLGKEAGGGGDDGKYRAVVIILLGGDWHTRVDIE